MSWADFSGQNNGILFLSRIPKCFQESNLALKIPQMEVLRGTYHLVMTNIAKTTIFDR